MSIDLTNRLGPPRDESTVNTMARGLLGSAILQIAAEIRVMEARGEKLCNLTVGDFKPREFPIPASLGEGIAQALKAGETNYPPSDGMPDLRKAVQAFYERKLGLKYPIESVVIAGGARPIIYGTYRAVMDPGDAVIYPRPSWQNNHYVHLMNARAIALPTSPANGFMPTADEIAPHIHGARMLALCSPQNPTGTMITADQLRAISQLVVDENKSRIARGANPLILMYDHIYWQLALKGVKHVTPIELVPEIAPWVVFVDGVSKAYAATGIRVGWGVGPPSIIARMRDVLGHVGAWAPRAEQVATAKWLNDDAAGDAYLNHMRGEVEQRLQALYDGLSAMRAGGLPVQAISPQGAIYLTVQFDLIGRAGIKTNEEIRKLLLEKAGFAVVPFQAFDMPGETGWFRLSVGAVSMGEIREALPRVEAALKAVA